MTKITTFCFKHKRKERVTEIEVVDDGIYMTLECGYKMRKFWKPDR
jgi:hypothetical protein